MPVNRNSIQPPRRPEHRMREKVMAMFEIFHEQAGLWRIRRNDGLVEGLFSDSQGAIRFVRRQYPGRNVTIVFRSPPLTHL